MNYDHLNQVYDFWRKNILPNLSHNFNVDSFNDYMKRFSFLPSGKWLREGEKIKLNRIGFPIDAETFVKKYKKNCIAYNAPVKPEDGLQRIIYQLSPTLHAEMTVWIWIENKQVQQYASLFVAACSEQEYLDFVDDLYKTMRKSGNTEDVQNPGFAELIKSATTPA